MVREKLEVAKGILEHYVKLGNYRGKVSFRLTDAFDTEKRNRLGLSFIETKNIASDVYESKLFPMEIDGEEVEIPADHISKGRALDLIDHYDRILGDSDDFDNDDRDNGDDDDRDTYQK